MTDVTDAIVEAGRWKGYNKELAIAARYFSMSPWQILVILGIGISGLTTFVTTYDAITNINAQIQTCTRSDPLRRQLNIQFIVLLILAILAILIGIILAWLLRNATNTRRIMTLGIIVAGIFGIIYAISIKLANSTLSSVLKAGLSWTVFIGFLIAGYFVSRKNPLVKPIVVESKTTGKSIEMVNLDKP